MTLIATALSEQQVADAHAVGRRVDIATGPVLDPRVAARCLKIIDRRGELWAAAILGHRLDHGRDRHPLLARIEPYIIVAADTAEPDNVVVLMDYS